MLSKNIVKYFFVGGVCFIVDFTLFYLFSMKAGTNYLIANFISFTIATIFNYFLCIKFIFESGARFRRSKELLMVFSVSCFSLLINQLILLIFVEIVVVDILLSKTIAIAMTFFLNYFGRSIFVFNRKMR